MQETDPLFFFINMWVCVDVVPHILGQFLSHFLLFLSSVGMELKIFNQNDLKVDQNVKKAEKGQKPTTLTNVYVSEVSRNVPETFHSLFKNKTLHSTRPSFD